MPQDGKTKYKQPNNEFNQQGGDPPMWAEKEVEKLAAAQNARQSKKGKK